MTAEAKAAKRGAKLLDNVRPGWARKINLKKFEIDDTKQCILGQAYGDFNDGLKELVEEGLRAQLKLTGPLAKLQTVGGTPLTEAVIDAVSGVEVDHQFYGFDSLHATDAMSENESYERLGQQWVREIKARRARA